MNGLLSATALAIILVHPALAQTAETKFPAVLVNQAVLPANTIIPAPADAPAHLKQAGKFTTPDRKRASDLGTVPGMDGKRPTGLSMPFDGQPMQGLSGIKTMSDGTFWTLSDNGFGSKNTSSDSMLMLHHITIDWASGTIERLGTVFLSDPDRKAPFPIAMEGAEKRYLTGADFDVESIQPDATGFWVGDEFGPYLLRVDLDGQLSGVYETKIGETLVRSPDNAVLTVPASPKAKPTDFNLKRSGGYEGLAMAKDGTKLYGLLEGPLFVAGEPEKTADGRTALRIAEFDVASTGFTGRYWLYPLSEGGEAIGDFNMIDADTALVIERDNGAGSPELACKGEPDATCFATPAKFKRIYKIEMNEANVGQAVKKIGYIDLLEIDDNAGKAKQGTTDGRYTMPFVTIENVDVVDATHIVVGNDNNLPFSAGRQIDKTDDNEMVLLEVGDFLKAK